MSHAVDHGTVPDPGVVHDSVPDPDPNVNNDPVLEVHEDLGSGAHGDNANILDGKTEQLETIC